MTTFPSDVDPTAAPTTPPGVVGRFAPAALDSLVAIGIPQLDESNVRIHEKRSIDVIRRSLELFGQQKPIVLDSGGRVRAGNGTLLAARELGWTHIWCVVSDLEGDEARAFSIADNRTAELSSWDDGMLEEALRQLQEEAGIDPDALGFTDQELAAILRENRVRSDGDADASVITPPETSIVRGDLFALGTHRLLCGDATDADDVARLLDGNVPVVMATDPPYGVNYDPEWRAKDLGKWAYSVGQVSGDDRAEWRAAYAAFPGGIAYVWHAAAFGAVVIDGLAAGGFKIRAEIIWLKPQIVISRGDYHWRHEPCFYAVREGAGRWLGDRKQSTIWEVARLGADDIDEARTGHSTQKPVRLWEIPMENHTLPGEAIYDPFCGSGTAVMAAEKMGRVCYAMEIDPRYVQATIDRWETYTGGRAVQLAAGEASAEAPIEAVEAGEPESGD